MICSRWNINYSPLPNFISILVDLSTIWSLLSYPLPPSFRDHVIKRSNSSSLLNLGWCFHDYDPLSKRGPRIAMLLRTAVRNYYMRAIRYSHVVSSNTHFLNLTFYLIFIIFFWLFMCCLGCLCNLLGCLLFFFFSLCNCNWHVVNLGHVDYRCFRHSKERPGSHGNFHWEVIVEIAQKNAISVINFWIHVCGVHRTACVAYRFGDRSESFAVKEEDWEKVDAGLHRIRGRWCHI